MENTARGTSGITFRQALPSDYNDVLELDNSTYDGFDYLPTLFHQLLQTPEANCYVAETREEGKVVGFYNLQCSDAKMAVGIAIRVHPLYQHRGIATKLKKFAWENVHETHPNITSRLSQALSNDYIERVCADPNSPETIVGRVVTTGVATTNYSATAGISSLGNIECKDNKICSYSEAKLQEMLTSPEAMKDLFYGKFFLCSYNWFPVRSTVENMKTVIATHKVFCSTDESTGKCVGASFGKQLQTENGLRYVSYLRLKSKSKDLILQHVRAHLEHILSSNENSTRIIYSIEVPAEFDDGSQMNDFMKMFGPDVVLLRRKTVFTIEETLRLT